MKLTHKQLAALNILITQAWNYQTSHGATSETLTDWRHEQCFLAVRVPGLSSALQKHYRGLKAHFQVMAGNGNFNDLVLAGKPTRAHAEDDTYQNRQIRIHQIKTELATHAANMAHAPEKTITLAYITAIAQAQYKKDKLDIIQLTHRQLTQLHYTLRNRIAAREGRGKTANRNKSQRAIEKTLITSH